MDVLDPSGMEECHKALLALAYRFFNCMVLMTVYGSLEGLGSKFPSPSTAPGVGVLGCSYGKPLAVSTTVDYLVV